MGEEPELWVDTSLQPHRLWAVSVQNTDIILLCAKGFDKPSISAVTPTWAPMNEELGFDYGILNDSYATGSATLCVGGLVFIPFTLKYGRRPVYIFSLLLQLACSIWSANIQTPADLFLTQAFNCLLGALAEVLVQMTIADLFFVHQRGFRNNMYVWTMMFGSALAPLASGYITVDQGWRWVWWWVAILLGASCLLFVFLYEETKFLPSINGISSCAVAQPTASWTSADQTTSGDKKSGGWELHPIGSIPVILPPPRKSYVQKLRPWSSSSASLIDMAYHSYQPLLVLTTVPAVLYAALLYGLVTAAFQVTITLVATYMPAPPYNFTAAQIGLMSLPPFIGTTVGAALSAPFSDRIILWLARRNQGVYEPEMRLWLMLVFAPLFPAGIILFGYSLGEGLAWPIVAVGLGIMSLAMAPIGTAALTYITDAYTDVRLTFDSNGSVLFHSNMLTPIVDRRRRCRWDHLCS